MAEIEPHHLRYITFLINEQRTLADVPKIGRKRTSFTGPVRNANGKAKTKRTLTSGFLAK